MPKDKWRDEELKKLVGARKIYTHCPTHRNPKSGTFFMSLTEFPGALFDEKGYVLFQTKEDYINCRDIRPTQNGRKINVRNSISSLPGYKEDSKVADLLSPDNSFAASQKVGQLKYHRLAKEKYQDNTSHYIEPPAMFRELTERIITIKNDGNRKERDHEGLVEHLFEMLGYKRGAEIIFQMGHIDVLIRENGKPLVTIEVKRDWALSSNIKKARQQAFNYALEQGTKYVIITNGDYYVVYDRTKGMNYDQHFLYEFTLTRLTEKGLIALQSLSKGKLQLPSKERMQ